MRVKITLPPAYIHRRHLWVGQPPLFSPRVPFPSPPYAGKVQTLPLPPAAAHAPCIKETKEAFKSRVLTDRGVSKAKWGCSFGAVCRTLQGTRARVSYRERLRKGTAQKIYPDWHIAKKSSFLVSKTGVWYRTDIQTKAASTRADDRKHFCVSRQLYTNINRTCKKFEMRDDGQRVHQSPWIRGE